MNNPYPHTFCIWSFKRHVSFSFSSSWGLNQNQTINWLSVNKLLNGSVPFLNKCGPKSMNFYHFLFIYHFFFHSLTVNFISFTRLAGMTFLCVNAFMKLIISIQVQICPTFFEVSIFWRFYFLFGLPINLNL